MPGQLATLPLARGDGQLARGLLAPGDGQLITLAGGAAFSPLSLPGSLIWLTGDQLVQSGGLVSQATDQGPTAKNATAAGAAQPAYVASGINGKPCWKHTSATQGLALPSITNGPYTVAMSLSLSANGFLWCLPAGARYLYGSTGFTQRYAQGANVATSDLSASWAVGGVKVIVATCDGTVAGQHVYVLGVDQTLTRLGADPGVGTIASVVGVANNPGPTTAAIGTFRQWLYWPNFVQSAGDIANLTAYLRADAGV